MPISSHTKKKHLSLALLLVIHMALVLLLTVTSSAQEHPTPVAQTTIASRESTTSNVASAAAARTVGTKPLQTGASRFRIAPRDHSVTPTALWGQEVNKRPLGTNDWWNNLVFNKGTSTVKTFPYMLQSQADRIALCMPNRTAQKTFIFETFLENISVGAVESLGQRRMISKSKLHATVRWPAATNPSAHMTVPLVRGQAYLTALFTNLTPRFKTIHAITSINGKGAGQAVTGTKFKLAFNNGQTWLVYAQNSITLTISGGAVSANARYSGYVRVVLLQEASHESVYDAHSGTYPVSGAVSFEVQDKKDRFIDGKEQFDQALITFKWEKVGSGPLLMFALPHHMDILEEAKATSPRISMRSIRGMMTAVSGDRWVLRETLSNTGFFARRTIPAGEVNNIKDALQRDKNDVGGIAPDPYFGGKQIAKMARLALISEQVGMDDVSRDTLQKTKDLINPWLDGKDSNSINNYLMYEKTWGGVVSKKALGDPGAEFGMGWYNDHHFHFGYFVYAAAVIARKDPQWAATYKEKILDLVRDYANPVNDDHFPEFRNKDWFNGHSYASGLFDFADSKNQESTSEGVNGYYGITLLGRALGNRELYDLGRILTATEIRSAQKYWQIKADNQIYDDVFKAGRVVGVLWETKVDYATFFGGNVEFIHCIQMLPYTPITEELLPADWIRDEYPVLATGLTRANPVIPEGWKGFIYMTHAIIDKPAARREIDKLRGYDDGNTKSNTLYWVVTRPGNDNQPFQEAEFDGSGGDIITPEPGMSNHGNATVGDSTDTGAASSMTQVSLMAIAAVVLSVVLLL